MNRWNLCPETISPTPKKTMTMPFALATSPQLAGVVDYGNVAVITAIGYNSGGKIGGVALMNQEGTLTTIPHPGASGDVFVVRATSDIRFAAALILANGYVHVRLYAADGTYEREFVSSASGTGYGDMAVLSGDGRILFIAETYLNRVHVFNADTGALIRTISDPHPTSNNFPLSIASSYDGSTYTVTSYNNYGYIYTSGSTPLREYAATGDLLPNAKGTQVARTATASSEICYIRDVASDTLVNTLTFPAGTYNPCGWNRNGSKFSAFAFTNGTPSGSGELYVYDGYTFAPIVTCKGSATNDFMFMSSIISSSGGSLWASAAFGSYGYGTTKICLY